MIIASFPENNIFNNSSSPCGVESGVDCRVGDAGSAAAAVAAAAAVEGRVGVVVRGGLALPGDDQGAVGVLCVDFRQNYLVEIERREGRKIPVPATRRGGGGGGGGRRRRADSHVSCGNKNRLSSTTCGEELQKIGKDWQSLIKGLGEKEPKID